MPDVLGSWTQELCTALELDPNRFDRVLRDLVLDLARDAAHGVARPAAPLTTFLVGYAAGLRGGSPDDVRDLAGVAQRLAQAREPSADG